MALTDTRETTRAYTAPIRQGLLLNAAGLLLFACQLVPGRDTVSAQETTMKKKTLADLPDGSLIQISRSGDAWAAIAGTPYGIYIGGGNSPNAALGAMDRFDPNVPGHVVVASELAHEWSLVLDRMCSEILTLKA